MRLGAFMKTPEQAEALARSLVKTAQGAGCMTRALITDMSQPLATAAGNALEVIEVMETLTGTSVNAALWDVTVALGGEVLALAGLASDAKDGEGRIAQALESGAGGRVFRADGRRAGGACGFCGALAGPAALGPGHDGSAGAEGRVCRGSTARRWGLPWCIWAGGACARGTR
jgi:thymidine phosphorylase